MRDKEWLVRFGKAGCGLVRQGKAQRCRVRLCAAGLARRSPARFCTVRHGTAVCGWHGCAMHFTAVLRHCKPVQCAAWLAWQGKAGAVRRGYVRQGAARHRAAVLGKAGMARQHFAQRGTAGRGLAGDALHCKAGQFRGWSAHCKAGMAVQGTAGRLRCGAVQGWRGDAVCGYVVPFGAMLGLAKQGKAGTAQRCVAAARQCLAWQGTAGGVGQGAARQGKARQAKNLPCFRCR